MSNSNLPEKRSNVDILEDKLDALPALDNEAVVERTLSRIMNAATAADIFANPDSQGLRDWAGRVIVLNAVAGCLPSNKKGALSRYVVLDCTDPETGETFAATSGSIYVVTAALRAAEAGALPATLRVVELESASNPGQSSLWLVKA